jgi:uncharacterized membrane protein
MVDLLQQPSSRQAPLRRGQKLQTAFRLALAMFFVAAGAMHFLRPDFYLQIMPPYLPWPLALVYFSGACEVLVGCTVVPLATRRFAGFGLIALLVAVLPANVQMAIDPEVVADWNIPAWILWLRLPFQGVLIAWVYWATQAQSSSQQPIRSSNDALRIG